MRLADAARPPKARRVWLGLASVVALVAASWLTYAAADQFGHLA